MTAMWTFCVAFVVLCGAAVGQMVQDPAPTAETNFYGYISGFWKNQHGSLMMLNETSDGILTGLYGTAVEVRPGVIYNGGQMIHGRVGKGRPTTFGFTVNFQNANGDISTSAWSGQYHFCDGKETLVTTWVLTSATKTCKDSWMATRIGQDKFHRVESTENISRKEFYKKKGHGKRKNKKMYRKIRQKARTILRKKLSAKRRTPKGLKKAQRAQKRNNL